jgi:hypothetical protein
VGDLQLSPGVGGVEDEHEGADVSLAAHGVAVLVEVSTWLVDDELVRTQLVVAARPEG